MLENVLSLYIIKNMSAVHLMSVHSGTLHSRVALNTGPHIQLLTTHKKPNQPPVQAQGVAMCPDHGSLLAAPGVGWDCKFHTLPVHTQRMGDRETDRGLMQILSVLLPNVCVVI